MKPRLPPTRANRKCWNGDDKVDGRGFWRATANQLPAFILAFPVVFHSQKERERGRERGEKGSIHKNLPWHENSQHVFLFLTLFRVSLFSLSASAYEKQTKEKKKKKKRLYISSQTDAIQLKSF